MNVVELTSRLVSIPSMNPMGRACDGSGYGEARLTEFLAEYLGGLGSRVEMSEALPGRPNLTAFCDMGRSQTVLLEAHMDTVPVDNMAVEPFAGEVRDGRLYGRGACDDKGPMAAVLCAIGKAYSCGAGYNVLFAAVSDEEYQFTGIRRLLAGIAADIRTSISFAVVAEPTTLRPVAGHKGVARWRASTRGIAAHSSTPELGSNAIYTMADVVAGVRHHAEHLRQRLPHPQLGTPSVSVGTIRGGTAANIVPDYCEIEIDRRLTPGETVEEAQEDLKSLFTQHGAVLGEPFMSAEAFIADIDGAAVRAALDAACYTHGREGCDYVNYCTDASFYASTGIPAVVFGPGSIKQAHTVDEYIETTQLVQGETAFAHILQIPE